MSATEDAEFLEWAKRVKADALRVLHEKLPAKLKELDVLVKTPQWNPNQRVVQLQSMIQQQSTATSQPPNSPEKTANKKRRSVDEGPSAATPDSGSTLFDQHGNTIVYTHHVPVQTVTREMAEQIREEVNQFSCMLSSIKLWIELNIPRIEDGNNFGVSVQEQILGDLTKAEDQSFAMLEQLGKYYMTRGKLASKVVKYPNLEDYAYSLREYDTRIVLSLRLYMQDIRDDYAIVYDTIMKNLERLEKPRGNGNAVHTMY